MRLKLVLISALILFISRSFAQISNQQAIESAAKWRYDRLKDEQGNFYPGYVTNALQQANNFGSVSRSNGLGLQWQELGPDNVGGYITSILIDARDTTNNTVYAGSFNGGVWKSTDGAATWKRLNAWNQWMAISCIEQAPSPDYTIYIGTGDGLAQPSGSSYNVGSYGNGIFKLDSDDNPVLLTPSVFTGNLYDPPGNGSPWNSVNAMAVNHSNASQIVAASDAGLFRSNDAGVTWAQIQFTGPLSTFNHQPSVTVKWSGDGQNIYADMGYNTATTQIVYSNDGGINWSLEDSVTNAGFPAGSVGRISLAIAPSNPQVVYALMATTSSCTKGLYRSDNAGATWTTVAKGGQAFSIFDESPTGGCQGWYDNVMAVSPSDLNKFYLGGINLYIGDISSGVHVASVGTGNDNDPYYITPDMKSITIASNNPDLMYIGCDGGVFKSSNALSAFPTPTYSSRNSGLGITLNYGIGADFEGYVIGGAQNNGTYYIDYEGSDPKAAQNVIPNVGIENAVSQINTNFWFGGNYFGQLLRSKNHTATFSGFYDLKVDPMSEGVPTVCGSFFDGNAQFITPFYLGETKNAVNGITKVNFIAGQNYASGDVVQVTSATAQYPFNITLSQNLNAGDSITVVDPIRSRLFLSTNCGVYLTSDVLDDINIPEWFKLTPQINGNAESFVTTPDGNNLYIGTESGMVYRFSNLNAHADTALYQIGDSVTNIYSSASSDIFATTVAQGRSIEGIDVDPANNNHVVAVVAGFSSVYSAAHVFESHDGGLTWVADTAGLPNMPVYSVVIHDSNTFIIGTEFGIWSWNGSNWHEDNGNFERVPVYRMIERPLYQDGCNVLYIGSSGRGMWRCTTLTPSGCYTALPTAIHNVVPDNTSKLAIYPNPASGKFNVAFSLDKTTAATLSVIDMTGRLVGPKLSTFTVAGQNMFEMDGSSLENGIYILSVKTGGGQQLNTTFVIAR